MMLLWRAMNKSNNYPGIFLEKYYEIFSFVRWSYASQLNKIRSEQGHINPSFDYELYADLAAACVATLFEKEKFKRKELVSICLQCCRDLLLDTGFDEADMEEVLQIGEKNDGYVILIAGCQSRLLVQSRVKAAAEIAHQISEMYKDVSLVFSGNNPSHKGGANNKVEIRNECKYMSKLFYQHIKGLKKTAVDWKKVQKIDVISESDSSSSEENVALFLQKMRRELEASPTNIILISSNFHLLRLSHIFLNTLPNLTLNKVRNLILVGSEDSEEARFISMQDRYVKSMFFELIKWLFQREDFLTYRRPLRNISRETSEVMNASGKMP
ncbi:MAG: ElyC/SanA/YdcF family protein [Anaerolineales bacterium]